MKKLMICILFLVIVSSVVITGCDTSIKTSESKNDKIFTTEKTETSYGIQGKTTTTKTCPFWDRDC